MTRGGGAPQAGFASKVTIARQREEGRVAEWNSKERSWIGDRFMGVLGDRNVADRTIATDFDFRNSSISGNTVINASII
jgi:hypothetical protein